MNKKISLILITLLAIAGLYFFVSRNLLRKLTLQNTSLEIQNVIDTKKDEPENKFTEEKTNEFEKKVTPVETKKKELTELEVPFIVQAPFGNWDDPVFQNACEEASIVMAMGWLGGIKSISPKEAQNQILDIVKFENKTFGYNADTDLADVEKIFKQYFNQSNVAVKYDISIQDIKNELKSGNLIIAPAFGQALGNINYTSPGPIAHMLVITGYDETAKQFITNDPGTKRGEGYKYNENVLFDAIWEYPSGNEIIEQPTKGYMKKSMIVIGK